MSINRLVVLSVGAVLALSACGTIVAQPPGATTATGPTATGATPTATVAPTTVAPTTTAAPVPTTVRAPTTAAAPGPTYYVPVPVPYPVPSYSAPPPPSLGVYGFYPLASYIANSVYVHTTTNLSSSYLDQVYVGQDLGVVCAESGQTVTQYEVSDQWDYVESPSGTFGWVADQFINDNGPSIPRCD